MADVAVLQSMSVRPCTVFYAPFWVLGAMETMFPGMRDACNPRG